MPFKSQKQRKWMFAAAGRGEIPKDMPHKWAKETSNMKDLPERKKKKRGLYGRTK